MHLAVQPEFEAVNANNDRLVVHRRSEVVGNRALAIFIHGLGGDRYGTWGEAFPNMLYTDLGRLDLGFYAYPTALQRVRFWRSISLREEAKILAGKVRTLREYERIVLIGHSMGGLLARGAAAYLATSGQKKVRRRLTGIITFASPLLGSGRVPIVGALFHKDLRVLYPHNEYLGETAEALATHFELRADRKPTVARNLPQWAIRASDDFWVNRVSSVIGIPAEQLLDAEGSHTEVAKPKSRDSETYRFVVEALEIAAGIRVSPFDDAPLFKMRPATMRDIGAIGKISDAVFEPDDQGTDEQSRDFLAVFPDVYRLICDEASGDVKGYFGILPLTADAMTRVEAGELSVPNMTAQDLAPHPGDRAAIYIGGLAGTDTYSKGWTLNELRSVLYSLAATQPLRLLTRPITHDGLRVVEGRGFTSVHKGQSGIGCLYERWIERDEGTAQ